MKISRRSRNLGPRDSWPPGPFCERRRKQGGRPRKLQSACVWRSWRGPHLIKSAVSSTLATIGGSKCFNPPHRCRKLGSGLLPWTQPDWNSRRRKVQMRAAWLTRHGATKVLLACVPSCRRTRNIPQTVEEAAEYLREVEVAWQDARHCKTEITRP